MPIHRAILSVYDKSGLVPLARGLAARGVSLVASGGTSRALAKAGLDVVAVSDLTGSPEILGGRVKTLHPAVHGGILSRRSDGDRAELGAFGWAEIDLVVVNLYPFEETLQRDGVQPAEVIEQIDIGGVALLRAAAKNYEHVTVVCDPADYGQVLRELEASGEVSVESRRRLAAKAFALTATYDGAIWRYLAADELFPERWPLPLHRIASLRYGENPHQQAALYATSRESRPLGGELLQGKGLSYNNLLDLDAAWRAAMAFSRPTVVIVKHLSPCGLASADSLVAAFGPALAADPLSSFGSVIAANRPFDCLTAQALGDLFVEAIVAPSFTTEALDSLAPRANCRLLSMGAPIVEPVELRSVVSGVLVQERDAGDDVQWTQVTQCEATAEQMSGLKFAWKAVAQVKSNAILLAQGEAAVGIGGGQPSRLDAVRQALAKAGARSQGAVLSSDAFFPFPDAVELAARAGVTALVQPGGSVRDQEVIAACDRLGLAMYFTGVRHFRH
jgi:phosphoribosylaminoimidazolecarboxamide formyltransferase/IMP cyclohydrolase